MKNVLNLVVLTLFLTLSTSCTKDSEDETIDINSLAIPEAKDIEIEIMELINAYRVEQGLNALDKHDVVKHQAFSHTDYMVETSNVSHANFFARKAFLEKAIGAERVTENVAFGFRSAKSVVSAWIKSDGHRENMKGEFTNFDVSAEKSKGGNWYFTNIFIKK